MPIIKYDMKSFVAALEPGIVGLVVHSFEQRLEEKLNKVIENISEELKKELPEEIKTRVFSAFDPHTDKQKITIDVEVNLVDSKNESM